MSELGDLLTPGHGSGYSAGEGSAAIPLRPVTADGLAATPDWAALARVHGFSAKPGECLLVTDSQGQLTEGLVGVENDSTLAQDPWWLAPLALALPEGTYRIAKGVDPAAARQGALGFALAQYRFDRYRAKGASGGAKGPRLLQCGDLDTDSLRSEVNAAAFVRDLVNTPTEDMGPADLESAAQDLAAAHGADIDCVIGDALLDQNFPTIHAVGRAAAADRAPRLIDMRWSGSGAEEDALKLTLVGKGVCFDTGGLNLKGGDSMRWMKKDMGGAAHVLGLARLIMERDLPLHLHMLIPAVENAVAGNAFRPGDVLTTRPGISVEIGNTDAEGRLVLSDALAYGAEHNPDLIIDFATLTGAARVALGPDIPPVYTHDEAFWTALHTASERRGDPLWRMPLYRPYRQTLKSTVADMGNISGDGMAGSITAALFLQDFTSAKPWAHFDVFAWTRTDQPGRPMGGAAQGLFASFDAVSALCLTKLAATSPEKS